MKLKKETLIYDISNLAYIIADTGDHQNHGLHRVADICQEGNIDRVARRLGHAYTHVIDTLAPIIEKPKLNLDTDWSAVARDYEIRFLKEAALTLQRKLRIKECMREFMVSFVLADWLSFTLPEAADIWRQRALEAKDSLGAYAETAYARPAFRRRISPL